MDPIDWEALAGPFAVGEMKWRQQGKPSARGNVQLLCYLDARAVADRLDDVVGPARWRNSFHAGAGGGVVCRLEIRAADGEWVWREDGAENTDIEGVKGGMSGAFKRAAVQFGIGRVLYRLPTTWVDAKDGWPPNNTNAIRVQGADRKPYHAFPPKLPDWAVKSATRETPAETQVRQGERDPSWLGARAGFCAELGRMGLPYDQLAEWCHNNNKPRPSHMPADQRIMVLRWLQGTGANTVKESFR